MEIRYEQIKIQSLVTINDSSQQTPRQFPKNSMEIKNGIFTNFTPILHEDFCWLELHFQVA